jgi:hypothetical protein
MEEIELQFDVIPIKIGDFLCMQNAVRDNFHINYNVEKRYYEEHKNEIIENICYELQFGYSKKPDDILNADILIVIDRITTKVIKIINKGFVEKEELKKLRQIDNIDYLQHCIKRIIGEE